MARVKFTSDFDYKPTSQVTIAYKAGMELTVKRDCAVQAAAAGKAVLSERSTGSADR
ncbi:hypothetical protein JNB88_05745 [Rhizobium cauense]|uniref:hypothetical protein n=1 Tax=Rhizobium cauense TaxID=1166683 RepID=UPI001C6EF24A|nr:hypothetical protein [Rhizobium cauense]MBW9113150.1 hypothetical protein [Rhizobium cauense]